MSKIAKRSGSSIAMELVERSMHLIRSDLSGFGFYHLLGSIPFWFFCVRFVETLSFSRTNALDLFLWSTLLASLYVWMRTIHCLACESARRKILAEPELKWSTKDFIRLYILQLRLSGNALLFSTVSANILVSSGLAFAYSQNTVACAYRAIDATQCRKNAWKTTTGRARVSHIFSALYSLLWIVLWANIAFLFYFVPDFLRSILGIENFMATEGWNAFSTTFITITVAATSVIANGLSKSFFTLLCFERESTSNGEDIIARLDRIPMAKHVATLAIASLALCGTTDSHAQESGNETPEPIEITYFDQSAEQTLNSPEYFWRYENRPGEEDSGPTESAVLKFITDAAKTVGKWLESIFDWLDGDDSKKPPPSYNDYDGREQSSSGGSIMTVLIILGIIVVIFLIAAILLRFNKEPPVEADPNTLPKESEPDLEDETIVASDMPYDRWLSLAAEKAGEGQHRLAVRAVFLASLALLGERSLIRLTKSKANFEYERELRRRNLEEIAKDAFKNSRNSFDRTWYGSYVADDQVYSSMLEAYGTIETRTR